MQDTFLYTRYPIVARALGLAARPSASREQRYLAYKIPLLARRTRPKAGRPSAARDDRVSCIQTNRNPLLKDLSHVIRDPRNVLKFPCKPRLTSFKSFMKELNPHIWQSNMLYARFLCSRAHSA